MNGENQSPKWCAKKPTVSTDAFEDLDNFFGSFVDFFRETSDEVGLDKHPASPSRGVLIVQQFRRDGR
jgi:hypothetical protein